MGKKKDRMCEEFHKTHLYDCPSCGIKLRDFQQELRDKVDAVPKELKQQFIDELKNGNVGYARNKVDPDEKYEFLTWATILSDQIQVHTYEILNEEVK